MRADDQLVVTTEVGELLHVPGLCYEVNSAGVTQPLRCAWKEAEDSTFVLEAPSRNPDLPLVVDPGLLWSTYLGGGSDDAASAVAVDRLGDVIVTGGTFGPNGFPTSPGSYQSPNGSDVFVTKFRGTDGSLIYSSLFGGATNNEGTRAIAVDSSGCATVVGETHAMNFPVTPGAFETVRHSPSNLPSGFALRLSNQGNALLFSTYIEGPQTGGDVFGVAIDGSGRAVICGAAMGQDFPVSPGAFQTQYNGQLGTGDGFVARLSVDGSALEWSTFLGGSNFDLANCLCVDGLEFVTAAGLTGSTDFPVTPGAFRTTRNPGYGATSMFVTKLTPRGDALVWSTYVGGTASPEYDNIYGLSQDSVGNVFVTGYTTCRTWPVTPGAFQTHFPPGSGGTTYSGFVTGLDASGHSLIYSTFLSSPSGTGAGVGVVDASGIVTVLAGGQAGFPFTPGAYDTTPAGGGDLGIVRLSPGGDRLFYATSLGGPSTEVGWPFAMSATGRVSVAGYCYWRGGYPTTANAFQPTYQGGQTDAVVTTLDLLLQGVEQYGASTPACNGPLVLNATKMPSAGIADFSVYCSGAPPLADGVLVIGTHGGSLFHVGSSIPGRHVIYQILPVRSDSRGYVETVLPIPSGTTGKQFVCQYSFTNPSTCAGPSAKSSSNGLRVTVQ
jgi:hypothetical protein